MLHRFKKDNILMRSASAGQNGRAAISSRVTQRIY